ncbi:MAG TPA: 16S rRNA (guanine(966)-N(2))-methyltransferase RsmD [Polyangiaceae bacterium]
MRIVAGIHRSREIRAPKGDSTRPTSDRVREALFSMLESARPIEGLRVLDLYAGTGALALEALSRGATAATLVEKNRDALAAIGSNVDALGVKAQVTVLALDVGRAASRLAGQTFDLVFADPPYKDVGAGDFGKAVAPLLANGLLAPSGRFVLELASRDAVPELPGLALEKARVYGDTQIAIFEASP